MNSQIIKLTKELRLKDDAITKAYLIIEAQQQQIQQLQQQSQSTSCRSSINRKVSKSLHEMTIQDYKNELNNILTYDTLFEKLLANQIKEQQILVNSNTIQKLEYEFQYWQGERVKLIQQLEKAATLYSQMEQQNQDLQLLVDQLHLENRVARQVITQLIQSENNSHLKINLIDLLSQMQIEALNQSFQTFSGFISEIVKYSTSSMRQKKIEDNYQVLDLKSENKQLFQQQLQNEIFMQEMIKILDIEPQTNSSLSIMKSIKQLKHKQIISQDKENNMNYNNYDQKLQNLTNQYNGLINQILEKFENSDVIITQLCFVVKSLLPEIQAANLKLLNGLNSSYRLIRNSFCSLRD